MPSVHDVTVRPGFGQRSTRFATRAVVTWATASLALLVSSCTQARSAAPPLAENAADAPVARERVRAFYSGHSLSDGVPEAMASIAGSLGRDFDYEFQSIQGSLLRLRTKGQDPSASDFPGYRQGKNRSGEGLDVAAELRSPRTLPAGQRYDELVVTERHDLPWSALHEASPTWLAHLAQQLHAGNPAARVWLYHSWLDVTLDDPARWMRYERDARPLWECVASSTNQRLAAQGIGTRVRVLPGATALVALVDDLLAGKIPDTPQGTTEQRLAFLFRDSVHLSQTGTYFMGLLHHAALFGASPEGASAPSGVSQAAAAHMQALAWRHVQQYALLSRAGAARSMAECRSYAASTMCPSFHELFAAGGWLAGLKRAYAIVRCQHGYEDAADSRNPFR